MMHHHLPPQNCHFSLVRGPMHLRVFVLQLLLCPKLMCMDPTRLRYSSLWLSKTTVLMSVVAILEKSQNNRYCVCKYCVTKEFGLLLSVSSCHQTNGCFLRRYWYINFLRTIFWLLASRSSVCMLVICAANECVCVCALPLDCC